MKVLVVSQFGNSEVKTTSIIPRIGEKVDMFYSPHPTVQSVLHWPSEELLVHLQAEKLEIDAIITVS